MISGTCKGCFKRIKEGWVRCPKCHRKHQNRKKPIKNPQGKCNKCSNACSRYALYCTTCSQKHGLQMKKLERQEKAKTKTRLAPGTGTKHRQMSPEDYERVFGKRPI